jgi:hypothetical protein
VSFLCPPLLQLSESEAIICCFETCCFRSLGLLGFVKCIAILSCSVDELAEVVLVVCFARNSRLLLSLMSLVIFSCSVYLFCSSRSSELSLGQSTSTFSCSIVEETLKILHYRNLHLNSLTIQFFLAERGACDR